MKFDLTETIEAPAEAVWSQLVEWERFERAAAGRGAQVTRTGAANGIGIGSGWRGSIDLRGKTRSLEVTITDLARPERMEVDGQIGGMTAEMFLTLTPAAPARTILRMQLDLGARTMAARLILQSVRLARGRVTSRIEAGFARLGDRAEAAWRRGRA